MYPLFEKYPWLEVVVPRYPLLRDKTPIQMLAPGLWIKRDDLTNEVYGGNKVRKLELILGRALAEHKTRILTFGATGTNHGVATTVFARKAGLQTTVILFDQPVTATVSRNLAIMAAQGAELWYRRSLFKTVLSYYLESVFRRPGALRLFAGGSGVEGVLAFVSAVMELDAQVTAGICPMPGRIVVPVGSSATLAGLALGVALLGLPVVVEGVRVAPSHLGMFAACTPDTVSGLIKKAGKFLRRNGVPVPDSIPFVFNEAEYGSGYGVSTESGVGAMSVFGQMSQGLPIEGTYTGKAFSAALKAWKGGGVPDRPILYWHTFNSADTGGLVGGAVLDDVPAPLRSVAESGF